MPKRLNNKLTDQMQNFKSSKLLLLLLQQEHNGQRKKFEKK